MAPADATTAVGLAARLGAYCRVEQQLFAVLGRWVVEIPEPDVKLALAEHADHAAWRARRWYELLPTAPPGADALVVVPPEADAAVATAAALADGPDRTLEKLAVAGRVLLPRLAAALHAHLDWTSPLTEPAVGRVLALCARRCRRGLGRPGAPGAGSRGRRRGPEPGGRGPANGRTGARRGGRTHRSGERRSAGRWWGPLTGPVS